MPSNKISLLTAAALAASSVIFAASEFVIVPDDDGGDLFVSADGSTLVGSISTRGDYYMQEASRLVDGEWVGLGFLDPTGNYFFTELGAVNSDGSVIVGYSENEEGGEEAFRWTAADGIQGLGFLAEGAYYSFAADVSADGSVIVGEGYNANTYYEAFRWTEADGMQGLGFLAEGLFTPYSVAEFVSADGNVIAGESKNGNLNYEAFRWTEADGMQGLGFLDPDEINTSTNLSGISADGAVIVGFARNENNYTEAFRWTGAGGMQGLGFLAEPADRYYSRANAVSADGSAIVGYSYNENADNEAFRWTEADGMQGLGFLAPSGGDYSYRSRANGVSADGSVVVGYSRDENADNVAFRWNETDGMQSVTDWLTDSGVEIAAELRLGDALGVSEDGTVVFGDGISGVDADSDNWIARVGSGLMTEEEIAQSIGTVRSVPQAANALPGIILTGAHHRTLLEQKNLDGENAAWINGDFANHSRENADIIVGEVGMAHDFAPGLRGGLAVGTGNVNQKLGNDGGHDLDGQFIMSELDYQIPETSIILSVLALYGDWESDIKRGYLNAGLIDHSKGSTDVRSASVRLRADWRDLFEFKGFSFTPRISYTLTRTKTDAYTETGGGFPASFSGQSHTAKEVRIGLTGEKALSDAFTFRGIMEGVYRMDKQGDNFSGQIIGIGEPFSYSGQDIEESWLRGGLELSYQIDANKTLTATTFGATKGEDAQTSFALNFNYAF